MNSDDFEKYSVLFEKALEMRKLAYTPYSHWTVGAALLSEDGRIFTGCNIENAAYGPTVCGERTAIFKAVSEGCKEFEAIAIAGGKEGGDDCNYCPPCGVCRQVMREFCRPDFRILCVKQENGEISAKLFTLEELLPEGFGPDFLL